MSSSTGSLQLSTICGTSGGIENQVFVSLKRGFESIIFEPVIFFLILILLVIVDVSPHRKVIFSLSRCLWCLFTMMVNRAISIWDQHLNDLWTSEHELSNSMDYLLLNCDVRCERAPLFMLQSDTVSAASLFERTRLWTIMGSDSSSVLIFTERVFFMKSTTKSSKCCFLAQARLISALLVERYASVLRLQHSRFEHIQADLSINL